MIIKNGFRVHHIATFGYINKVMKNRRSYLWLGAVVAILLFLSAYLLVNARSSTLAYALSDDAVNMDPLEATDINSWNVMSQIMKD